MAGLHASQHLESEIVLRRKPQPARFSLMRSCSSLIARTKKVAIDLLEPCISHVE